MSKSSVAIYQSLIDRNKRLAFEIQRVKEKYSSLKKENRLLRSKLFVPVLSKGTQTEEQTTAHPNLTEPPMSPISSQWESRGSNRRRVSTPQPHMSPRRDGRSSRGSSEIKKSPPVLLSVREGDLNVDEVRLSPLQAEELHFQVDDVKSEVPTTPPQSSPTIVTPSRPRRNIPTPVYKEPSLRMKLRKGHKFRQVID
mmetsp:Transcript_10451/g.15915  ORF Transcript_10451/g.15915 Transcript_10451/m.15915 type:complete len:197 (+) Transcript_10451:222-812(+)